MATNVPRRRDANKLATTNITNELTDAFNALNADQTGLPDDVAAGRETVWFQITGNVSGQGGRYTAKLYDFDARGTTPSTNLAAADLGTAATGNNAEVWNPEELGTATHWLGSSSYGAGLHIQYRESDGVIVAMLPNIVCRTSSPQSLASGTSETANTDSWDRTRVTSSTAYGDVPVTETYVSRIVYNPSGDQTLYAFTKTRTFDAGGKLVSISAETRVTVETPTSCS